MALVYTAQTSEGDPTSVAALVTALLGGGTGLFVKGYMDGNGVARDFMPAARAQAANGDAVATWFPQVSQKTAVMSSPGTSDNAGPIKLYLTAETADTVQSSSPMTVILDRFATVITVTGTF